MRFMSRTRAIGEARAFLKSCAKPNIMPNMAQLHEGIGILGCYESGKEKELTEFSFPLMGDPLSCNQPIMEEIVLEDRFDVFNFVDTHGFKIASIVDEPAMTVWLVHLGHEVSGRVSLVTAKKSTCVTALITTFKNNFQHFYKPVFDKIAKKSTSVG